MVSRTELNKMLAKGLDVSSHTMDRIGVRLREAGLIKSGGRGPYAVKMGVHDLVIILFAVMGSSNANQAADAAMANFVLKSESDVFLGTFLVEALSKRNEAEAIEKIMVCRSHYEVTIFLESREIVFLPAKDLELHAGSVPDPEWDPLEERRGLRVDATLPGNILYQFMSALTEK